MASSRTADAAIGRGDRRKPGTHFVVAVLGVLVTLGAFAGACHRQSPEEAASAQRGVAPHRTMGTSTETVPPFDVSGNAEGLLLLYWDADGSHIAKNRDSIPVGSREHVRVDSLELPPDKRLPAEQVYVADLRAPIAGGRYRVQAMPRASFEEIGRQLRAAAKPAPMERPRLGEVPSNGSNARTPQGPTSVDPQAQAGRRDDRVPGSAGGARARGKEPSTPAASGEVVLYGASWCGVCRAAARYFRAKGIPFREVDIERDPKGRDEMERKANAAGIVPRGIPVIDFQGKLLPGFDSELLDRLIRERAGLAI